MAASIVAVSLERTRFHLSNFGTEMQMQCNRISRIWIYFRMKSMLHYKARDELYIGSKDVRRFPVPDDKVTWSTAWPEYKPVDYTAPPVLNRPVWADPDFRSEKVDHPPKYNEIDGKVDRRSFNGKYEVVDGVPRNIVGRTGIVGRGLLGRWGPNHAADPIVTRWKQSGSGSVVLKEGKPVLEFVAIRRKDNNCWAIPGGMVEPGDTVSATLKKEFGEEAMNSLEASEAEKEVIKGHVDHIFSQGVQVYEGYVDDPRNTDNAWMETVACNFHDDAGDACARICLQAGDDAGAVSWKEISKDMQLHANHVDFLRKVAELHGAAF